jgi:DNA-binding CsgD family transcriptional regulator
VQEEMKAGGLGEKKERSAAGTEARRRRRNDFGSFKLTDRDVELLGLIAEQYTITLPQLATLIGLTERTARWLRDRWRQAGLVTTGPLAVGQAPYLWLTGKGSRYADSPFRVWEPNHSLAVHIAAVTDVRIVLERQLARGTWTCERAIAQQQGRSKHPRSHLPDGILDTGTGQIAIEVELHLKSRLRLEAIMEQLGQRYDHVGYFAPDTLMGKLQKIADNVPYRNVQVYRYPPGLNTL